MVTPGGIGLHGNCLGAWLVLLLASFRTDLIKAVVAVSPTSLCFTSSYKYRGKLIYTEDGVVVRHSQPTDNEDNDTSSTYSAIPPYQNISCPLLMVMGTGDLCNNVSRLCDEADL